MSYDLEDEIPLEPTSPPKSPQPMPRLWKTDPEPTEEESPSARRSPKHRDGEPSDQSTDSKASTARNKTKSAKEKGTAGADEQGEKKVLIEDTPAFDTYDARRRARLIMGALGTGCVLLFGWTIYRAFLYDPVGLNVTNTPEPTFSPSGPESKAALDQEAARFMFNRAQELAKNGRTDQAVAMLNKVAKVYKGTPSGKESKAALDRASKNLPLFSDSPLVVAQPETPKRPPEPAPPPAVVEVSPAPPQPAQGQATLVLPANPAETMVVVTPPNSPARTGTSATTVVTRPLPQGFQANHDAGTHESGWPFVIVGDRDGAPMVLVPGGTFAMGSNEGQPPEAPVHQVHLSAYYIDQHEVTNRQFRVFLHESHYRGQPPGKWLTDDKARAAPESSPVVYVNFHDADSFAAWAGKQLSTEAQWEMAARSTDGRRYPWGDEAAKWSRPRAFRQVEPVMTFPEDKSPYGIFDMAGNVQEWTRDVYDPTYYHLLAKAIAENPAGPAARGRTPQHVVRGADKNWSVTHREGVPADRRLSYLGFRCVLAVEAPGPGQSPGNPTAAPTLRPPASQAAATVPF